MLCDTTQIVSDRNVDRRQHTGSCENKTVTSYALTYLHSNTPTTEKKYQQDKKYVAYSFILKLIKLDETSSSKISSLHDVSTNMINKFHIDWINTYN